MEPSPRFRRIQKRLEELLSTDLQVRDNAHFEALRDPSLVRDLPIGLAEDSTERAAQIFCRLALLFEAGVFLEHSESGWHPRAVFHQGRPRPVSEDDPVIALPRISPLQALKTPSGPILASLGLTALDPRDALSAYLVQPTPEIAFLILSGLPDLWLKDHMNRVVSALADAFSS